MPSCNSDSWRRYTLKCLCWCVKGKVGELVQPGGSKWGLPWGLLCVTSGSRKLCMATCLLIVVIFMRFGETKGWGDALKSLFEVAVQATRKDSFNGKGGGGPLYVILLYWNFIVSLTGYCKLFYRILPLFPILLLLYLFCFYWDWVGQNCNLKIVKLTLNYTVIIISACTQPCDTNTFTHSFTRIHLLQLKTHNIWMKFFLKWKSF